MTRTNARSILTLIVRTLALWWALSTALGLVSWMIGSQPGDWPAGMIVGFYLMIVVCAGLLWVFADLVARAALAGPGQTTFESEIPIAEWQRLSFASIGAWQAIEGLVGLSRELIMVLHAVRAYPDYDTSSIWVDALTSGIQVGIGVALMLGARGLVSGLSRLRGRGALPDSLGSPSNDGSGGAAP